jgi:hypothetical protein
MELHLTTDTVEPSLGHFGFAPGVSDKPKLRWADVRAHLECCALGRTLLGTARWAVVAGLIVAGYFGASAINHALHSGSTSSTQPILAASTAQK